MTTRIGERAVVLGVGTAGLLAARVLSDAYSDVVVIDHDRLPDGAAARRCVPQGRHIHVLVAGGMRAMEKLLPGLTAELVADGAPMVDQCGDVRWYLGGHRLRQAASGLTAVSASRPNLERRIRSRVAALPGVRIVDRCDALGPTVSSDGRRVTGVRVLRRADGSGEEVLDADLVVDATGRGSRTPAWLEQLGYPPPAREEVRVDLTYVTRTYTADPAHMGGDLGILLAPSPPDPRGAALQTIENGRCLVTAVGMLGHRPPASPEGWVDFVRSLPWPDVYDAIRDAEPLDAPRSYHFPASRRVRYERCRRLPQGLLVIGDAVCSFDPIYAQGMSVAAFEAVLLAEHLARGREPDPHRWFRDVAKVVAVPWDMATGGDLAWPEVEGRRGAKVRVANRYLPLVHAAAVQDAEVVRAFFRVAAMVDPPGKLFAPPMLRRVLRRSVSACAAGPRTPAREPATPRPPR
ncbi:FAD-binding monooxygenase [Rhodococcus sp. GXMU-t2271]|uniref:NAD(P)/FAD-dependent oxidoreductase n=1 Tax=Rhodococcus sp. GXMU-t2271 TaxID=3059079 RepID=UPI003529F6FD